MTIERRQHRWLIKEFVSVFQQDSNVPVGHVADIHGEGMRILTREPLIPGNEQELTMHLPLEGGRLVEVPVDTRTVWTQLGAGELWQAGLRISRLTPEAVRDLQFFVEKIKRGAGIGEKKSVPTPAAAPDNKVISSSRREEILERMQALVAQKAPLENHPHILEILAHLWGDLKCTDYLQELTLNGRLEREGFSNETFNDLMFLLEIARQIEAPDPREMSFNPREKVRETRILGTLNDRHKGFAFAHSDHNVSKRRGRHHPGYRARQERLVL